MKIYNAKITKVKTKINEDFTITVKLHFVICRENTIVLDKKVFYDAKENEELKKIMEYTDTKKLKSLKGKIILGIVDYYGSFTGIGSPIGSPREFVLFSDVSKIYSEDEIKKMN